MRICICLTLLLSAAVAPGQKPAPRLVAESATPATTSTTSTNPRSPAIVIGFVGGFIRHDDFVHGPVQLAARIREEYPSGVYVKVFENHRGKSAYQDVLRLLDADRDGTLSVQEKQDARIIIYGHSWGGSETITLARQLQTDGIPVLLTVQVDSIAKRGENDSVIPVNVAHAVNFYQSNGLLHGRSQIRAADPARTKVIESFRFDYGANPVQCVGYPWFARVFEKTHIEIECDPAVLNRIESLIRSQLSPAASARKPDGQSTSFPGLSTFESAK
jgi:hypothetical protein